MKKELCIRIVYVVYENIVWRDRDREREKMQ